MIKNKEIGPAAAKEFQGKYFYPSSFFWQTQYDEPDRVRKVCRVLNTLTPEQVLAVEYLIYDRAREEWS